MFGARAAKAHGEAMTRVAVYTRLSSDPTGTQTATLRQGNACRSYAEIRGWIVVEEFEDVDLSAYNPKVLRPAYLAMTGAIERRAIDGVLVWKLDRLVRRPAEFEKYWQICERNDVFLASVTEPIDTTTQLGLALVRILVTFGSLESATTSTRLRDRNAHDARSGRPPSRPGAYGHDRTWTRIVPAEAAVIREAASRVMAGESFPAICRRFNERRLPSPGGVAWRPNALRVLLRSPRLVGDRTYRGEVVARDCLPAILSREIFDAMGVARPRQGPTTKRHLLTGVVLCSRCGTTMYSGAMNRTRGYSCTQGGGCGRVGITGARLEDLVIDRLLGRDGRGWPAGPVEVVPSLEECRLEMTSLRKKQRSRLLPHPIVLERKRALERAILLRTCTLPDRGTVRQAWDGLPLDTRRGVIYREIERITVRPAIRRGTPFDPSRVAIVWHGDLRANVPRPTLAAARRVAHVRVRQHAQRWLTLEEAAARLGGISPEATCKLVIDGLLPAYRDLKELVFRDHEVDDLLRASRVLARAQR